MYLYYALTNLNLKRILGDVGVPGLNREMAYLEPIHYPEDKAEQRKIAYVLSTVQKAIEQQDKLIKTTTELKKALMQKLFTEGLYGEKQKQTEIGPVPESWEVVRIGDVVLKTKGGGTPSTKHSEYWGGNIHWTTSKWLKSDQIFLYDGEKKITKKGLENSSTNLLPENNLLISTRVVIGKVSINKIPIAYSQDLTGLWIDDNKYNLQYLAYQILHQPPIIRTELVYNYTNYFYSYYLCHYLIKNFFERGAGQV